MKKAVSLTIGIALVAFCTAAALAGIGPSFGLPTVTLATGDNNYYNFGTQTVAGRNGSVMCVACHTRNPAFRTAYRVANTWAVGSHFVTRNFTDTSEGGGYSDGTNASGKDGRRSARLDSPIYMAGAGGVAPATWAASPRYGQISGTDNIGANITNPSAGTRAQMICESCHSIVANIGTAKLLANGFNNDNAALCIGCHGDMDPVLSAEWQYSPILTPNDNAWAGTAHHRNSHSTDADTLYYGSATDLTQAAYDMGSMNRTYWATAAPFYQMWSAGYGSLGTSARAIQWSGERMIGTTPVDNNQISPAGNPGSVGGGFLLCTNCHRAHNADASMGATILARGVDTTTAMGTLPLTPTSTQAWQAVRTMEDRTGRAASVDTLNPMCLTCHR